MKITYILLLVFIVFSFGCGEFEASRLDENAANFEVGGYSSEESDEDFFDRMGAILTEDAEGTNYPTEVVKYEEQIGISFGSVSRALDFALKKVREKIWIKNCSDVGTSKDSRQKSKQYRCGELPVGDIISDSTKRILQLDIAGRTGNESGISYSVDGASIPVLMERDQKWSRGEMDSLNNQEVTDVHIQSKIFNDVYFKIRPDNGILFTSVCTFLPGNRVYTGDVSSQGSFKKKIWFLSLKAKSYATVNAGSLNYDHVKVCALLTTQINKNGKPEVKIASVLNPEFSNLKTTGFTSQVRTESSGLLSSLNFVTKLFGYDLEKMISDLLKKKIDKYINKQIDKIKDGDVYTGKWLEKYISSKAIQIEVVDNLNTSLQEELVNQGPGQELELKLGIESACLSLGQRLELEDDELNDLCRHSFSVAVKPFVFNQEDYAKGCYQHYLNPSDRHILDRSLSWWASECHIQNRITITAPPVMARIYSCLADVIRYERSGIVEGRCDKELDDLKHKISEGELDDLIDRAKEIRDREFTEEREKKVRDLAEELFSRYSF